MDSSQRNKSLEPSSEENTGSLDELSQQGLNFSSWNAQPMDDLTDKSGIDGTKKEENTGQRCPRKRPFDVSSESGMKACREKLKRGKLNDRFKELGVLPEGNPAMTQKSDILSNALFVVKQLRKEAGKLKESNEQLRQNIKQLKTERNELDDERTRLKDKKERLEQHMKAMTTMPHGLMPYLSMANQLAAQYQLSNSKNVCSPDFLTMPMWQFLPPSVVDTSQDHILRPPVA